MIQLMWAEIGKDGKFINFSEKRPLIDYFYKGIIKVVRVKVSEVKKKKKVIVLDHAFYTKGEVRKILEENITNDIKILKNRKED